MPVDKQVLLRYRVLNECFRNRHREYTIDDLVNECLVSLSPFNGRFCAQSDKNLCIYLLISKILIIFANK